MPGALHRAITLLVLLLTQAFLSPSAAATSPGTAIILFLDFSGSIKTDERALFKREIESKILPSLSAGDRLLMAPIHDKTLTEFRPLVQAILPAKPEFSVWRDNVLTYNRRVKEVEARVLDLKAKVKTEVADVLGRRYASPYTDIFSSLLIAQKLFHEETRRKVLVLMSDMIEDTPEYNFEKITWSPSAVEKLVAELEAKALIPKLPGVCVYVSGASAKSATLAENIARFWEAYFRRTGADMHPSRYAHVLLHWPPSQSCGQQ
ncbi:MAG: hypothetical protein AUI33_11860 [Ignavibacteria bacterium 13_1_40CM_2_61_4]|nr:MAG: hypothetical protein AUI33_11860 [Ignavibacteria bacterium 13_1_40CM_2_61_4]